ncbi:MAG: geranylgeranyl diphosphate reductase [Beijerinckiaceae bacterium]|nr:geranylgeranyl diphosphate reductase [Beijerinckiaceae bacterium]
MTEQAVTACETFDVVVVGGGPAGATAASDLAKMGRKVMLLDRQGRIKPCGGAIPPRLIKDFDIPDHLLCARIRSARMIAPSRKSVDMPVENGFVGMVDRDVFDEFLRVRAAEDGADRRAGNFVNWSRDADGVSLIEYRDKASQNLVRVRAHIIVGADGANSAVARLAAPKAGRAPFVFAYHEIIRTPEKAPDRSASTRCEVYYQSEVSPDFYGWVFPHGDTMSVGVGSAAKGFSLRDSTAALRKQAGLEDCETIRKEGAPLPLYPAKKWDNGRDVVLAGDAAGVVAPASGEGIYYAMATGRLAAEAANECLQTGDSRALATARKRFMKEHGRVFFILWIMQTFWYRSDKRREKFVALCKDPDIQRLTWESYMNKKLVRRDPLAHVRVFFKDLGQILGLART